MSDILTLEQPPLLSGYYKFGQKYRFNQQGYFVFGSNLAGVHGAGAAKYAAMVFGAQFGRGEGFTGRSYAIPTKDKRITTLPLPEIAKYIKTFTSATDMATLEDDPDEAIWFYVTPVGTGLAGYKHEDIAPLFQGACRCWFPDIWKPYLGEYPGVKQEYQEQFIERMRNDTRQQ